LSRSPGQQQKHTPPDDKKQTKKTKRPRALNALNAPMVNALRRAYEAWGAPGSGVGCVVIQGAGGKVWCVCALWPALFCFVFCLRAR
jgi:hypothetical protein